MRFGNHANSFFLYCFLLSVVGRIISIRPAKSHNFHSWGVQPPLPLLSSSYSEKILKVIKLVEAFCLISEESYSYGSHDTGDPSTTNLYIGNINPTVSWNLNLWSSLKCLQWSFYWPVSYLFLTLHWIWNKLIFIS